MSIYVINLKRNPERLHFITEKFNSLNLPFDRIDAVDGYELSEAFLEKFRSDSKRKGGWMPGQIGCFLSHFNAWKKIANGDEKYGIIFEDDLHISSALPGFLADLSWIPSGADIVRLENATNLIIINKETIVHNRELLKVESDSWCAGGYILSKKSAQFLINQDKSVYQPVDWFIFAKSFSKVANDFNIYQIDPSLACQDKNSGGMITTEQTMSFDSEIEVEQTVMPLKQSITLKNKIKNLIAHFLGYRRNVFKD